MAHIDIASHRTLPRTAATTRRPGLMQMLHLWRSRRALAALDTAQLNDIGITAKDAAAEAARPIWDVPVHWRG